MIGGIVGGGAVGGRVGTSVGIGVGSGVIDGSGVNEKLGEILGDSDRLGDGDGRARHVAVGGKGAPHDLPYGVMPGRNR